MSVTTWIGQNDDLKYIHFVEPENKSTMASLNTCIIK